MKKTLFIFICVVVCFGATTTYQPSTSTLWDNIYGVTTGNPRQNTFARYIFNTNTDTVNVFGYNNIQKTYSSYAHFGFIVNDSIYSPITFSDTGYSNVKKYVGASGTTRRVQIIVGLESKPSGTVLGTFIDSIQINSANTFVIDTSGRKSKRILFYGTSITSGGNATNPETQGYLPLLRTTYKRNAMCEGWGFRSLNDDVPTASLAGAFARHIDSCSPTTIWLDIGINDYLLSKWRPDSFAIYYGLLLDTLKKLNDSVIFCQTPLIRNCEDVCRNSFGDSLGAYRNAINTACGTRSWTRTVAGKSLLTLADLDDGIHPTTSGHAKLSQKIDSIILYNIETPCSLIVAQGVGGSLPLDTIYDNRGDTNSILATAATCYTFVNWTRSDTGVTILDSTSASTKAYKTSGTKSTVTANYDTPSGVSRTWSSSGDLVMNTGTNYSGSGSLLCKDSLLFNNTSVVACSASTNLTAAQVTIANNYTGIWKLNGGTGRTLTCADGFSDDGITGVHSYGPGITCNGSTATVHFNPGATPSSASLVLTLNGTGGMTYDDDKGLTIRSLVAGNDAKITSSGSQITGLSHTATMLTMGTNSILTLSQKLYFYNGGALTLWSLGTGSDIQGNSQIQINSQNAGLITIPAITRSTGTGGLKIIQSTSDCNTAFTGTIYLGSGPLDISTTSGTRNTTISTNGNTITCAALTWGSSAAGIFTANCSTSVFNVTSYSPSTYTNNGTINLSGSTWYCSGGWTYGANHTISPGTSTVIIDSTGTVTTNGKTFCNLELSNPNAGTTKLADSLTITGNLTLTDGRDSLLGISCANYTNNNPDSVIHNGSLSISGNLTRSSLAKVRRVAGIIAFSTTGNHSFTGGSTNFGPVTCKNLQFMDSAKIQKITIADSATIKLASGYGVGIDTIADYEGSTGKNVRLIGPGRLKIPRSDTVSCQTDSGVTIIGGTLYLDTSCRSLGSNAGIKSLSYNGVTKSIDSGIVGSTFTFSSYGFVGGGWSINGVSQALTVNSYTQATATIPSIAIGTYSVKVWNSDADTVTVGTFKVYAPYTPSAKNNRCRWVSFGFDLGLR